MVLTCNGSFGHNERNENDGFIYSIAVKAVKILITPYHWSSECIDIPL